VQKLLLLFYIAVFYEALVSEITGKFIEGYESLSSFIKAYIYAFDFMLLQLIDSHYIGTHSETSELRTLIHTTKKITIYEGSSYTLKLGLGFLYGARSQLEFAFIQQRTYTYVRMQLACIHYYTATPKYSHCI